MKDQGITLYNDFIVFFVQILHIVFYLLDDFLVFLQKVRLLRRLLQSSSSLGADDLAGRIESSMWLPRDFARVEDVYLTEVLVVWDFHILI